MYSQLSHTQVYYLESNITRLLYSSLLLDLSITQYSSLTSRADQLLCTHHTHTQMCLNRKYKQFIQINYCVLITQTHKCVSVESTNNSSSSNNNNKSIKCVHAISCCCLFVCILRFCLIVCWRNAFHVTSNLLFFLVVVLVALKTIDWKVVAVLHWQSFGLPFDELVQYWMATPSEWRVQVFL